MEVKARKELYAFGMVGKEHSPDNSDRMTEKIDAFAASLADIVRSYAPKEPESDDSGTEEAIAYALNMAASAVERGFR